MVNAPKNSAAPPTSVFIVGTGRCGSTLLSDMVRLHPKLLDLSELLACQGVEAFYPARLSGQRFWRRLAQPRRTVKATLPSQVSEFTYPLGKGRYDEAALPPILHATLPRIADDCDGLFDTLGAAVAARPRARLCDHYRFMAEFLCREREREMWVERSGASALMLPAILKNFPDAKIVHIVRDGRETALSMADHPAFRLLASNRLRFHQFGVRALRLENLFSDGSFFVALYPLYEKLFDPVPEARRKHPLTVYGAFWSGLIGRSLNLLGGLDRHRVLQVPYERLVAEPHQTAERLAVFLGLPKGGATTAWIDAAAKLPQVRPSRFARLGEDERQVLHRTCAAQLNRLGYPGIDGPVGTAGQVTLA
ncbi:MAG: sulfotransferase [Pseudomonadota bacterium]